MKTGSWLLAGLYMLVWLVTGFPAESTPGIICGQTITEDTVLTEDLYCPPAPGNPPAITIGASNITLDLGGHTLSGHADSTGILVDGYEGITIKHGSLEGFNTGVFIYHSPDATVENLLVRNLDISDPDLFIIGVQIEGSQDMVVRNSQFEFLPVAHKEAVDIYSSNVLVDSIEVRGGGAGVGFSFAGACDPVNAPNTGTVTNSRFSDIYIAGFYIACGINIRIEGNEISTYPGEGMGLQVEAPHPNAVIGLNFTKNYVHDAMIGIELRRSLTANVHHNYIYNNSAYGVWVRHSLGCIAPAPGWECFDSTNNTIADNETWGSGTDLYHHEDSTGNTWQGNTCETTEGADIPACLLPNAVLSINYASGKPGSFFTIQGANYPISSTVTITVNGQVLGTVPTDAHGDLSFSLSTDQADPGPYIVDASANPGSAIRFVLDPSKPLRQQAGPGPIFDVPGGLVQHVYLPLILKTSFK